MQSSYRRQKRSPSARKVFWQLLRSCKIAGSMPSWALPIETITAWMYLGDRQKRKKTPREE